MARGIHEISATPENRQDDYQISMVEIEGMMKRKTNYILIDPGASLSYVSPRIAESCKSKLDKFEKSWLVQLATGAKSKVVSYVKDSEMIMKDFKTQVSLNVLPLGSYDILISMDWLEKHHVVLNCFDKTFTCLNENGDTVMVKGVSRT